MLHAQYPASPCQSSPALPVHSLSSAPVTPHSHSLVVERANTFVCCFQAASFVVYLPCNLILVLADGHLKDSLVPVEFPWFWNCYQVTTTTTAANETFGIGTCSTTSTLLLQSPQHVVARSPSTCSQSKPFARLPLKPARGIRI